MKFLYIFIIPIILFGHGGEKHEKTLALPKIIEVQKNTKDIYSKINTKYLKDIKPIFESKCFDCHRNQTKYPWYFKLPVVSSIMEKDIKKAKEHLDFSNDFPFISHETPKKDLVSILETLKKKTMPPLKYTIIHSESKVTDQEIKKIEAWVENSLQKLK